MSNYVSTTITVSRSEYDAARSAAARSASLSEQVAKLTDDNSALQANLDRANQRAAQASQRFDQAMEQLRRQNEEQTARNAQLQQRIQSVWQDCNGRIDAVTAQTQQDIRQLRTDLGTFVTDSINRNNALIEGIINRNNTELIARMDRMQKQTDADIQALHAALADIKGGDQELLNAALDLMDRKRELDRQIASTRHELLLPGKYKNVQEHANNADTDIRIAQKNPANSPNAFDKARTAYKEAFRFFEEIRLAELEWQAELAATEQVSVLLREQFENSRVITPRPNVNLDVEFWSHGDLSATRATFEQLQAQLQAPEKLTKEQLIDLQSSFRHISETLDEVVDDASIAAAASQQTTRTAEKIRRRLAQDGLLELSAHAFMGNDRRGNYRIIVKNPNTRAVVVVTVTVSRDGDQPVIHAEADIADYGTMSAASAEHLIRNVLADVNRNISKLPEEPEVACHEHNRVVHPERSDIHSWTESKPVFPAKTAK